MTGRLTARADVLTEAPARYAKQLVSHLGHKAQVEQVPDDPSAHRLKLSAGTGVIRAEQGRLVMRASAADAERLANVEGVLGRHLEKFGRRNELVVTWQRDTGE